VNVSVSFLMTLFFLSVCILVLHWIFKTGYRLKN
jgi:ABC-2 type transport system permease protein